VQVYLNPLNTRPSTLTQPGDVGRSRNSFDVGFQQSTLSTKPETLNPLKTWGVKTRIVDAGFQDEAGPSNVPEHTFWMVMRPLRHHFWFLFLRATIPCHVRGSHHYQSSKKIKISIVRQRSTETPLVFRGYTFPFIVKHIIASPAFGFGFGFGLVWYEAF